MYLLVCICTLPLVAFAYVLIAFSISLIFILMLLLVYLNIVLCTYVLVSLLFFSFLMLNDIISFRVNQSIFMDALGMKREAAKVFLKLQNFKQ